MTDNSFGDLERVTPTLASPGNNVDELLQPGNNSVIARATGNAIGSGNGKSWVDGEFLSLRSEVKKCYDIASFAHKGSRSIPVVEYQGETYVIGDLARIKQKGDKLSDGFKNEYFVVYNLTLLALQGAPGLNVYNLGTSVPDQATAEAAFLLDGMHDIKVNGENYTIHARSVLPVPEGIGASLMLGGALIVDWGTQNTTVAQLDKDGTIVHQSIEYGTIDLIRAISEELSKGKRPSDRQIINGLEKGTLQLNGAGLDFSAEYEKVFSSWVNKALTDLQRKMPDLFNTGEVVYFGGGGSLLQGMAEVREAFGAQPVNDPQKLEVQGLAQLGGNADAE